MVIGLCNSFSSIFVYFVYFCLLWVYPVLGRMYPTACLVQNHSFQSTDMLPYCMMAFRRNRNYHLMVNSIVQQLFVYFHRLFSSILIILSIFVHFRPFWVYPFSTGCIQQHALFWTIPLVYFPLLSSTFLYFPLLSSSTVLRQCSTGFNTKMANPQSGLPLWC